MSFYKVLLWCVTLSQAACSNTTICVASEDGRENECQGHHVIHRLSDLTYSETSNKIVRIYLTSGTHFLNTDLYFNDSVEETEIHGTPHHGQPSIIECRNAGIRFSENRGTNRVLVSNVALLYCQDSTFQAALFFKYAQYTLNNVAVRNSEGYGLYADQCYEQVISNCTFAYNAREHVHFELHNPLDSVKITINKTKIHDGKDSGIFAAISDEIRCNFSIFNCEFFRNKDAHLQLIVSESTEVDLRIENSALTASNRLGASIIINSNDAESEMFVILQNSTFSYNEEGGLLFYGISHVEITNCTFANNNDDGIWIGYTSNTKLVIADCLLKNNIGTGLVVDDSTIDAVSIEIEISRLDFFNNSRALTISFPLLLFSHETKISECRFTGHRISQEKAVVTIKNVFQTSAEPVILANSSFVGNHGSHGDCSALLVKGMGIIVNNISIADNNCTGITLYNSAMIILENTINFTRNHGLQGGALALKGGGFKLIFTNSSELNIIDNTADTYGGGIYSDATCENDVDIQSSNCFFRLDVPNINKKVFAFSGNSAIQGGDIIFGGCLSNCLIDLNEQNLINKSDSNNTFWKLVSTTNTQSPSTFVEQPKSVAFCTHSSQFEGENVHCTKSYKISAYRGQIFTVPLMVTDGFCYPSVEIIEAKVLQESERESTLRLERGFLQKARKSCYNFSYAVRGGLEEQMATITFKLQQQLIPPVTLAVQLQNCPKAYEINSKGKCACSNILKSYNIECNSSHYLLTIPAQTWVGELRDGDMIVVKNECQFCNNEERELTNITQSSDELCTMKRHGIMCGACSRNYSLQLGGYECADCSNSTHKGVLLMIAFTIIGIALVLLVLGLNLTVSTGMINGLIFYSNIVYLNSDALLPITREGNSTHLQNVVKFLSTFQAWMNLDFGIITCFFDGYDAYISTWMQFVFPLYIWMLILIIVLASRYSNGISKITTSNTVSVLATLLLLSYAKLLKTSIEAFSSVQLQLLDGNLSHMLWKSDANISYLGRRHVPLFLVSIVMVVAYVIPFTLLILLGPLLQAKSHVRFLSWINKLKPFLDSFYGPYTSKYRYWPGILLLIRLVILFTFAFYSTNDTPHKLTTVSVMIAVLLAIWLAIGKTNAVSIHQKSFLNYLELFLHLNLGIFTISSAYYVTGSTEGIKHRQGLAVAMVGSVFAVFCGILAHQIFCTAYRYKAMQKMIHFIATKMKRRRIAEKTPAQETKDVSEKTTHSLVEMVECNNELREPLLTNS